MNAMQQVGTRMNAGRAGQLALCAAVALGLNAAFTWAAFVGTATVPPLRVWQQPAAVAPASVRLSFVRTGQAPTAALVE